MKHDYTQSRGRRTDWVENGDCMQEAEFVMVFDAEGLAEEYYVMRNEDGEYCGIDSIVFRDKWKLHVRTNA